MRMIKSELISAFIMSILVTFLVWISLPASSYNEPNAKNRPVNIAIKSFILSFATTYAIFYFISDAPEDTAILSNIICGEPDF